MGGARALIATDLDSTLTREAHYRVPCAHFTTKRARKVVAVRIVPLCITRGTSLCAGIYISTLVYLPNQLPTFPTKASTFPVASRRKLPTPRGAVEAPEARYITPMIEGQLQ